MSPSLLRIGLLAVSSLMLLVACASKARPTTGAKSESSGNTTTVFDNMDPKDTVEDTAYSVAGEAIIGATAKQMVGQPAPQAVMRTIDGEAIDLGKSYGTKPAYIKFWATWCVPCRQQMPSFEKMYEALGDKIQMVALNIGLSDDGASVRAFQQKYGMKMPVVMDDGHLASLFQLSVTPQHVVIGKDGRVAYVGHADNAQLTAAIKKVISATADQPAIAQRTSVETSVSMLRVGDQVPDLSATTIASERVRIGGPRPGKIQAVEFFASWCEWYLETTRPTTSQACARTRKQIAQIAGQDPAVDWIGIAGGPWATVQDLTDYQTAHNVTMPLAVDTGGTLFHVFGIRDIPIIVLIDSAGKVAKMLRAGDDIAAGIRAVQLLQ